MQAVHMRILEVKFGNTASASMPVVWLSLADQIVIIGKDLFDREKRTLRLSFSCDFYSQFLCIQILSCKK